MKGMSDPLETMYYDEFCNCYTWLIDTLNELDKKRKR